MKKVKYETENERDVDAFFEESFNEHDEPLQNFANDAKMSALIDDDNFTIESKPLKTYLKQAFLFFPGVFILFYVSLATAGVLTDILIHSERYFIFEPQLIFVYLLGFLSVFLTWLGLGDLKNKKHLVIPGSIIFLGAMMGIFVSLTDDIFWLSRKIIADFGYAIYLFPIALVVPFLAKGWVDKESR